MNNPKQLNYTQQLEHRLKMISEDISIFIDYLEKNKLIEACSKPTSYADYGLTHIHNIDIACRLDDDEALSWNRFNK